MDPKLGERTNEFLRLLDLSKNYYDPNESRGIISGLDHALNVANLLESRTHKNSGLPFAGLIHDLARPLNDVHHGEVVAEIVKDRVPLYIYHLLYTHGLYQEAVMHNLPFPKVDEKIIEESKPVNFKKLALIFTACEMLSFNVEYKIEGSWTYEKARRMIIHILD